MLHLTNFHLRLFITISFVLLCHKSLQLPDTNDSLVAIPDDPSASSGVTYRYEGEKLINEQFIAQMHFKCQNMLKEYDTLPKPEKAKSCPPKWSKVMCWPKTPANTEITLKCPKHVESFTNKDGEITINCTSNGTWYNHDVNSLFLNCMDPYHGRNLTDSQKNEMIVLTQKLQKCRNTQKEDRVLHHENSTEGGCPPIWKTVMCWPRAPRGMLVRLQCPDYVSSFKNTNGHITIKCSSNSTWDINENDQLFPYRPCLNVSRLSKHMTILKLIKCIGYITSMISLVLAFLILISMRKLKCARNRLHLNLFVSFIIRAGMCLLMDYLFTPGYLGLKRTIGVLEHLGYATWDCRLFLVLWHYTLMANYSWIFMEGLYLHNLIFLALSSDHSGIRQYVVLGWSLPVPFVVIWALVRATVDNHHCWTDYSEPNYEWILRGPISLSILVNFIFFIRISMVLFNKLNAQAGVQIHNHGMKKWIKSTLVLVPLFGAYYIILLIVSLSVENDETATVAWLYCDTTFTAFQGFVVAVLYCFVNSEVQAEIRRKCQSLNAEFGTNQSYLTQTQTRIYTSRGTVGGARGPERLSCHSLHNLDKKECNNPENLDGINSSLL